MIAFDTMRPGELSECAALAARAFYGYEYFSIYFPGEERRHRFLDALVKCEFKANRGLESVRFMTAKEDGRIVAVAQLCAPGFAKPSSMTYILSGWLRAQFWGGSEAIRAWGEMEAAASAPCHSLPGKNWYLSLLAVDASSEGKGIGSGFLRDCLIPYAKQRGGETLSLFTNSDLNRRFYQKNGFVEFDAKEFTHKGQRLGSWSYLMRL